MRQPVLDSLAFRAFRSLGRAEDYIERLTRDDCTTNDELAKRCIRLARTNHRRAVAFYGAWMTLNDQVYMPSFEERSVAIVKAIGA